MVNKSKVETDSSLFWYWKRLQKMSVIEIAYRLNQAFKKNIDKYYYNRDRIEVNFNGKEEYSLSKFYSAIPQTVELFDLIHFEKDFPLKDAENILDHEFEIFGIKKKFGKQINFHYDPKTEKSWPLKFWGDIDYRDSKNVGGIKFAWELNRLNHWPVLAIVFVLTQDQKYLIELMNQLENWLTANPYPYGINWISGIEIGIRIVNLYYTLRIIGNKISSNKHKKKLIEFFYLHGNHLYRYPAKYSSRGNHTIAEALGLFIAGLSIPKLKNSLKWKTFGKNILEREVTRQIYPDGSSFEHSTHYLKFVLEHYIIYYILCKENKESIGSDVEKRINAACNFISAIVDIDGNVPNIGDSDDGHLIKLGAIKYNDFISLLTTASILFNKAEWIHPKSYFDFKTLLLIGSPGKPYWKELKESQAWRRNFRYFENAGIAVIAHQNNGKEILFIGNSGPLGLKPLSGHGHADALSFWLSINGKPFFVDTGTYLYHSGGKWRRYFRSTAAHNTVQIDNQDQAEQISDFMFGNFYQVHSIKWSEKVDRIDWGAEHTGYKRLIDPVIHRREVSYLKRGCIFKINDLLRCCGKHNVQIFFHLHPKIEVMSKGKNKFHLIAGNDSIVLKVDKQLKGQVISGDKNLLMGWYSPGFNRIKETTSLVFTKEINGDYVFKSEVTVL